MKFYFCSELNATISFLATIAKPTLLVVISEALYQFGEDIEDSKTSSCLYLLAVGCGELFLCLFFYMASWYGASTRIA